MGLEPIGALKLLSDLFITIAEQLNKLKGTPKKKFAREMIELFDILDALENDIEKTVSWLTQFENEPTIGMRCTSSKEMGHRGVFAKRHFAPLYPTILN